MFQQALAMRKFFLRSGHPDEQSTREAFALMLERLGRIEEAARIRSTGHT
jgi:hypothetical protein